MTLTIDLKPETEAGLLQLAGASGKSPDEYVKSMLEITVGRRMPPDHEMSNAERAAAWVQSAGRFPETPLLSDASISRENIYSDRG